MKTDELTKEAFEYAWKCFIDIVQQEELTAYNFRLCKDINDLDDVFNDGGEIRCVEVMDKADEIIAERFKFNDEFDSPFYQRHMKVVELFDKRLLKWIKSY